MRSEKKFHADKIKCVITHDNFMARAPCVFVVELHAILAPLRLSQCRARFTFLMKCQHYIELRCPVHPRNWNNCSAIASTK